MGVFFLNDTVTTVIYTSLHTLALLDAIPSCVVANAEGKQRWYTYCPLAEAGVVRRCVLRFWLGRNKDPRHLIYPLPQGFDLGLRDHEGNCDDCTSNSLPELGRASCQERVGQYW